MLSNSPSRLQGDGDAVLIAAQSGRAIAAAARRAGFRPYVADLFGDSDTRTLAAGYRQVAGSFGVRVSGEPVLRILDDLAREAGSPLGVILGSGFEAAPDQIALIGSRHQVLGCSADTVRLLKDPASLAALLDRLGVPHPTIGVAPVADPRQWLVKRAGGSGGGHIRAASRTRLREGFYLQRRVSGVPHSFAFLANGRTISLVATTRQWTAPGRRTPFRYGGAVEPGPVSACIQEAVMNALRALTRATGLCGLASADCLIDGEEWWLLEINPRPGATLDILDRREIPLLRAHVEACLGRVETIAPPAGAAASEILYATRTIPVVPDLDWPDYVMDRPEAGSRVAAGAPLCTVVAQAANAVDALNLLRTRTSDVRAACLNKDLDHATASRPSERQRPRRTSGGGPCR
jgi:predicted ATP-grasp superfamily ATP-dependent carboligase